MAQPPVFISKSPGFSFPVSPRNYLKLLRNLVQGHDLQKSLTLSPWAYQLLFGHFCPAHPGECGSASSSGWPLCVHLLSPPGHSALPAAQLLWCPSRLWGRTPPQAPCASTQPNADRNSGGCPPPASLNTPCWLTAAGWDPKLWVGSRTPPFTLHPQTAGIFRQAPHRAGYRTSLGGALPASYRFPLRHSPPPSVERGFV